VAGWWYKAGDAHATDSQIEEEEPRTGASLGLWWPQCLCPCTSAVMPPLLSVLRSSPRWPFCA
jgi:hypothetical protein